MQFVDCWMRILGWRTPAESTEMMTEQWRGVIGETPLHWAAHNGHQDVVASLIDAGADVDAADASGKAALEHASEAGHDRVARVLRDSGG